MNKDKPALVIGQSYRVEKVVPAYLYTRPGPEGGRRVAVPAVRTTEVLKLVEKQANGVCLMERQIWKLRKPPFVGSLKHKWKPAVERVKVKQHQIKEAA